MTNDCKDFSTKYFLARACYNVYVWIFNHFLKGKTQPNQCETCMPYTFYIVIFFLECRAKIQNVNIFQGFYTIYFSIHTLRVMDLILIQNPSSIKILRIHHSTAKL